MATGDFYTALSGQGIYAGMTPPIAWMPSSGYMGRVSLNNMSAAFDTTNPNPLLNDSDGNAILNAWCSTVFCSDWGAMGGIGAFGGGHQDRVSNAVYMYDIATRLWSRISDATPLGINSHDYDTTSGDVPAGAIGNPWKEYWTDGTRTAVKVGKVGPPHTYGNLKYVPGSAAGNVQGFIVLMGGFSYGAHRIDLDNPSAGWDRCGPLFTTVNPTTQVASYGCAVWDSLRNRLYSYPVNTSEQTSSNILNFPSLTVATSFQNYMPAYYAQGRYSAADDRYLVFRTLGPTQYPHLVIGHPTTGAKVFPTQGGPIPSGFVSMEWDEERRRLVGWDGTTATLWFAQAPSNIETGTWIWSSTNFINPDPIVTQNGQNGMYDRLHFNQKLQAFFVVANVNGAVQCWKI